MTGKEIVLKLQAKLNHLNTSSNREIRPDMMLMFLNDSYTKLVRAKYTHNVGADGTALQLNQLTTDDLSFLTISTSLTPAVEGNYATVDVSDISNYWYLLRVLVTTDVGGIKYSSPANTVTLDESNSIAGDPFNMTVANDPVLIQEDNKAPKQKKSVRFSDEAIKKDE